MAGRADVLRSHCAISVGAAPGGAGGAPPRPATWPEEVLQHSPVALTDAQRRSYFEHGCLLLPGFLSEEWLAKLRATTTKWVEHSRQLTPGKHNSNSDDKNIIFAPGHTADAPRLTRLANTVEVDEVYWQFATGPAADVAQDLLGPDVKFHHSKLNFKPPRGSVDGEQREGSAIRPHQDIQFWPHTNYTPLTIGVYLDDVTEGMGPMQVIPLSAYDTLHALTSDGTAAGAWTGVVADAEMAAVPVRRAVSMVGPAGTLTVHNARCVHWSAENVSASPRPLLLNTYTAATAQMIDAGTNPLHKKSRRGNPMVRGRATTLAVLDPRPVPMAPNFSGGYKPPFFATSPAVARPNLDG